LGGVVRGSTGHAGLSFVDQVPTPTTLTGPAAVSENVTAGSTVVTAQDGVACATTCLFAIDLSGVTFSGTQFKLYISQDGFSQIAGAPEDIQYGPTFNVADFSHSPTLKEVDANVAGLGTQKFYIGNVGGTDVVVGPIPIQISSAYNFIKIFDGQVTSVAVTSGTMNIVPGLTLSPTSGPAGSTVSATGGGFPSNKLIDLVYSYSTVFQNNTGSALQTGNWTTGINTTAGY